jgi:hypothetical protein
MARMPLYIRKKQTLTLDVTPVVASKNCKGTSSPNLRAAERIRGLLPGALEVGLTMVAHRIPQCVMRGVQEAAVVRPAVITKPVDETLCEPAVCADPDDAVQLLVCVGDWQHASETVPSDVLLRCNR